MDTDPLAVTSSVSEVVCLLAGCSYPGREGYPGGGRWCLGGQDVLQLPGQEKPVSHHGVPAWRFDVVIYLTGYVMNHCSVT